MSLNNYLEKLSSNLVLTKEEKEKIDSSVASLQDKINAFFTEVSEHFCFGSFTRSTNLPRIIDKHSDVDYLIVFKKTEGLNINYFYGRLREFAEKYYPNDQVIQTHPIGIVDDNGIKIELIPAYKEGKYFVDYKIPDNNVHNEWLPTVPNDLNEALTKINNKHDDLIVPLIRLIKYWNVLNEYVYSSYFLEKDLIQMNYPEEGTLLDYFYFAIINLGTNDLTEEGLAKVNVLKETIQYIQNETDEEMALYKLATIIPFI